MKPSYDGLETGWDTQRTETPSLGGMIRRQFWIVALCFILALLAGLAFVILSTPLYTATASIYAQLDGIQTEAAHEVQLDTHVALIGSDATTAAVIDELGLAEILDPEPRLLSRLLGVIARLGSSEAGDPALSDVQRRAEVIRQVQENLSVSRVGVTAIIDVRYTSPDKQLAVDTASAFARQYVSAVTARATQSANNRRNQLQGRTAEVEDRIFKAHEEVRNLRLKNDFVIADADDLGRQLAEARGRISQANAEEAAIQARIGLLSRTDDGTMPPGTAFQTPEGMELYKSYSAAVDRLETLRGQTGVPETTYAQHERAVGELRVALDRELQHVREQLGLELAMAEARRMSARGELQQLARYAGSSDWSDLLLAEREADMLERIYESYLNDMEGAYRQGVNPGVRVASEAMPPLQPSFPNPKVILAMTGVLGLVLGLGLALLREWNRSRASFRP